MTTTTTELDELKRTFIGQPIEELDTPCLLLDWQASEYNLRYMADYFRDRSCKLRPHFKNHKCVTMARKQIEAGSCVGMTAAKVGEAEVLADHGFENILIANQVVGKHKVTRLVEIARKAQIAVAVDHITQATQLSEAAEATGVTIGVLIEVDTGMGRCGAAPGQPSLELTQQVSRLPNLRVEGLQSFEGHTTYINSFEARTKAVVASQTLAIETRRLIENAGIGLNVISGGATATYAIVADMDGFDEVQAGTYATMDWRYHEVNPEFKIALSLLATVISVPRPGSVVLDHGVKGTGGEFGKPIIKGHPEIEVPFFISEEHLVLNNTPDWQVGQTVQVISSHACTTCNLHRHLFIHENDRVVDIWPIEAAARLS